MEKEEEGKVSLFYLDPTIRGNVIAAMNYSDMKISNSSIFKRNENIRLLLRVFTSGSDNDDQLTRLRFLPSNVIEIGISYLN